MTTPRDPITIRADIARQLAASRDLDPERYVASPRLRREAEELISDFRRAPVAPSSRLEELCAEALAAEKTEDDARRARFAARQAIEDAKKAAEPKPDPTLRRLLVADIATGRPFWITLPVEHVEVVGDAPVANQHRSVPRGRPITADDRFGIVLAKTAEAASQ
ncbi:hypothetical protein [Enterovirga aerilata]|uniref:Uncharacterized protein n=1 Tax=Enterovirga aerilata TaxID=2730920 RepID=A0A849I505_9HYPH|nr:hypothetical protein [Enterovirga sp. DB1703]NNM72411.1 hypothetical protein [Enterovirga sp. DB1703]